MTCPTVERALHLSRTAQEIGNLADNNAHYVHRLAAMLHEKHGKPLEEITVGQLMNAVAELDALFTRVYGNASGL